jgi:hypothetical protein
MEVTMEASILDLRYKMHNVLKALGKRETVRILYHGRVKGEIVPFKSKSGLKTKEHPIFGILKGKHEKPENIVAKMRRSRYHDL